MIVLAFLISLTITPVGPAPEMPHCSMRVLYGGPSAEVMYVHAIATGTRMTLPVDEGVALDYEVVPDSAVAFELRVIEAVGGLTPPERDDVILVTPWGSVGDCSLRAWDGPWVEDGEETVLTFVGPALLTDGRHFHVRGGIAAYPQGWWHAVHGGTYPDRGPGDEWMESGQFFELLESLPPLFPYVPNEWREAHEGVIEILRNGPPSWSTMYPGTEILETSQFQLSWESREGSR